MDKNLNIKEVTLNKLLIKRRKQYAYFPHMCKILHAFSGLRVTISILPPLKKY